MKALRSTRCPVSTTLDLIGDKWSLLIIRDIIFQKKYTYNEMLESVEGIATNILANRLKFLEKNELIIKRGLAANKLKKEYVLTEKGISMLPIIVEIILWGTEHLVEQEQSAVFKEIKKNKAKTLKKYTALLKERLHDVQQSN
ncbi:winged helix-turn-helix transcriptional regulator [Mucilaginibacter jinjuensis]|uniref:Helix-turn-helix domain-containing protein n=1 Tax=Mucilaginibacter jinjuensis TaxID=1176721 RepID=A0ABY7TB05_9SPHI|nr:helix-turn-helix domain-containing protein [Mucilaginibacter jinjuensis]WCT13270.1 helix-turn-helix domain-containing protein [Mucilaginibacter jinjuensis]